MHAHPHAHGLIGTLDRRQCDTGLAGAEDDRRNNDMQAIETAGREKTRDGVGTAFDQHAAHTCSGQRCKDYGWCKMAVGDWQADYLHPRKRGYGRPFGGYQDAPRTVITENSRLAAKAAFRVDDHAGRLRSGHPTYRQLGVVGYRRTDPDNDRVDQGPQPVQVGKARGTVDVFRMARFRRNAPIERLADLTDDHEVVDKPTVQRAENLTPGLWQGLVTCPENIAKLKPRVG
jgi:hypothetical protein